MRFFLQGLREFCYNHAMGDAQIKWPHSGKRADSAHDAHDSDASGDEAGTPVTLDGAAYLVSSHYYVPYFAPAASGDDTEKRRRERLNIELCDRVFRISDARDVARKPEDAEAAIKDMMARYEGLEEEARRGTGRVLFGRIVSRIRDLSRRYLYEQEAEDLKEIERLYSYVMVEQRNLFTCVRLYDDSIDEDGIIEEAFSEIGKPQKQSLESIYASRVGKIGQAMAGIHKVENVIDRVLYENPTLPLGEVHRSLDQFATQAARLVGFPSTDYEAYDNSAADYIDAFDAIRSAVSRLDHLEVSRARSHKLAEWLHQGIKLIHSMQNIRDIRANSIAAFEAMAKDLN